MAYLVVFPKDQFLVHFYFLSTSMTYQIHKNFSLFFLFADVTNTYCESSDLSLTRKVDKELKKVKVWLDSYKLALNVEKTNFVLFHSTQKIDRGHQA